jgi:hypothetical protein
VGFLLCVNLANLSALYFRVSIKYAHPRFKYYGEMLGFKAEVEVKIPRGKMDCVWESKEPVSEYFIAFEFETAIKGPQIVENFALWLNYFNGYFLPLFRFWKFFKLCGLILLVGFLS